MRVVIYFDLRRLHSKAKMTRSSVNPPQCGVADRYDAESHPSDDFVNVFGEGSDLPDHINDTCTIAGGASSHPRPMMLHASKQLIEHLNDGNEEFLDVNGVAEFLQIPRTQAHCIVDVLEVFQVSRACTLSFMYATQSVHIDNITTEWLQIIIPRGPMYTWRGTTHVALLLQSDKFKGVLAREFPRWCSENCNVKYDAQLMISRSCFCSWSHNANRNRCSQGLPCNDSSSPRPCGTLVSIRIIFNKTQRHMQLY